MSKGGKTHNLRGRKCQSDCKVESSMSKGGETHRLRGRKCRSNSQHEKCQRDDEHGSSTSRGGKTHRLMSRNCRSDSQHEVSSSRGSKTHRLKGRKYWLHLDTLHIHQNSAIFHCTSFPKCKINISGTFGAGAGGS